MTDGEISGEIRNKDSKAMLYHTDEQRYQTRKRVTMEEILFTASHTRMHV